MTIDQVRELLARECAEAGGQAAWARLRGVSPAYVSDVLQARHDPGDKVLRALGLERVTTYRPAE